MKSFELSRNINAPRELLWEAVVDPDLYRLWTHVFTAGSHFDGGWNEGDKIKFVTLDEDGLQQGMTSEIAKSSWPQHISIRHLGLISKGIEDFDSDYAKIWAPTYENYTFEDLGDGKSVFKLYMEVDDQYLEDFIAMWQLALDKIATICEDQAQSGKPSTITLCEYSKHPPAELWAALTDPDLVRGWNFADESWHCPKAENNLAVGGEFHYEMAARDGSVSFDFWGTYTLIEPESQLNFTLGDGRTVAIHLAPTAEGSVIYERFEAEGENNLHLQRMGWSMILKRLAAVNK